MTRQEYDVLFDVMKYIALHADQHDSYLPNEDMIREHGWDDLTRLTGNGQCRGCGGIDKCECGKTVNEPYSGFDSVA